jgi:hypothetical protein
MRKQKVRHHRLLELAHRQGAARPVGVLQRGRRGSQRLGEATTVIGFQADARRKLQRNHGRLAEQRSEVFGKRTPLMDRLSRAAPERGR